MTFTNRGNLGPPVCSRVIGSTVVNHLARSELTSNDEELITRPKSGMVGPGAEWRLS